MEHEKKKFSLTDRLNSFRDAFNGIFILLRNEHNARIHLFILFMAIIAAILLDISGTEWLAILIVSGLVFMSECFNTAVEYLSDQITGERE